MDALVENGVTQPFTHVVSSNKDYSRDWTAWLAGDTLSGSTWAVSPSGPVLSAQQRVLGVTSVFFAGGVVGTRYKLTNTISTAGGRSDARVLLIDVVAEKLE